MQHVKKAIQIPKYSLSEELISSISHGVGGLLGISALVLLVVFSAITGDPWKVASCAVYGATLIILYTMSTIYHALRVNKAKRVFRVIDHCSVFLLIAGTYTPFTLVSLRGVTGWWMFGVVWGAAVLGIVLNCVDLKKFAKFSMICYIAMGWVVILAIKPMINAVGASGMIFMLLGGIAYTIGAAIYGFGKKIKYMHSLWHFFVLAGSILQFFTILFYVI